MNSDGFYPGREDSEEWVRLDSVENVECSVPAVRVLADIKVDGAEDSTEGNPRDGNEDTKSHVRRKYRGMKRREGLLLCGSRIVLRLVIRARWRGRLEISARTMCGITVM
jgi:hypothetical protein